MQVSVCLSAALQESPWAGNNRRVLWVGAVALHPHLKPESTGSRILYWGFFCNRVSPSLPVVGCLIEIVAWASWSMLILLPPA